VHVVPSFRKVNFTKEEILNMATGMENVLRILVVDDYRDAADAFVLLLRTMGCDVRVAYTGVEALDIAAVFDPHVAFLDIAMPDIDGYDMALRLRNREGGRKIKLVAVTGLSREADRRRGEAAGFDLFLVKPVSDEVLQAVFAGLDQRK
jgi:CheY-like chemotaxis protein